MTAAELAERLNAKRTVSGNGWIAHCPGHHDRLASLSIAEGRDGRLLLKCHAGCSFDAILAAAGLTNRSNGERPTPAFDWSACVSAFSDKHVQRLVTWRGYREETIQVLLKEQKLGLFRSFVAFPVQSGTHYREKDGSWRYYPVGTKPTAYVIGDISNAPEIHVFESQWDAIAMLDRCPLGAQIATRGAANGGLLNDLLPRFNPKAAIYLWPQNDEPGRKWLRDVLELLPRAISVTIPGRHKDLNDWTRAGANWDLLSKTYVEARDAQRATMPDLASLLQQTSDYLKKYIAFSCDAQPDVIALWVAHTWVIDAFDYTPYLYITAPEKQCGKSRVLDCLEVTVAKPFRTILPSESVLYREIEDTMPTLLLDEIDGVFAGPANTDNNKEPLRAILNDGFYRGAVVPRCIRSGDTFVTKRFRVFCAKAFAGIGGLPDTVADRSITIRMARRSPDQIIKRFRRREVELEVANIKAGFQKWAASPELIARLRKSRPILPEKLSDRQQDIAEPLLAIADEAGGDWREKARQGLVQLCEGAEESESAGVKLLRAIFSVLTEDEIFTSDLLSRLPEAEQGEIPLWWVKEMDNKRTGGPEKSLATMLRKYGIKSTRLRIDDVQRRGYRKADFMTTWKKYLPDLFAQNPSQASHVSQKARSVTDGTDVTRF